MTALPDRYGEVVAKDHVVTNNFLVSVGIVTGACGLAVMGSSIIVTTGEFYYFANFALEVLQQTQFVIFVSLGALILGFLGILTGFLVSCSGLFVSRYPKMIRYAVFCLILCAAGNIAAGALIMQGVSLLNNAIYDQPAPVEIGQFTACNASFECDAIHFQIAMFNACCAPLGYSEEIYTDTSDDYFDISGYVQYCGAITAGNLDDLQEKKERTCYTNQEIYRLMNYTVQANAPRICATLTAAEVNIAGDTVPGTTVDVSALTNNQEIINIVGPIGAPNYGCGIGFAKAFQAAMIIWCENILQPVGTAFVACGAVYLLLTLVSVSTFYACSQSHETAEEKYVRYMEEIQKSSQGTRPNQIAESFEQANPKRLSSQPGSNRASVQNPNRLSMQSYATHNSNIVVAEFAFNVDDKI